MVRGLKFQIQVWFGLVLLMLYIPVNNFSVMSGRSHRFLGGYYLYFSGSKCVFAPGHNTAVVGIKPPTSCSGVQGSITRPPRSPSDSGSRWSKNKGSDQLHGSVQLICAFVFSSPEPKAHKVSLKSTGRSGVRPSVGP